VWCAGLMAGEGEEGGSVGRGLWGVGSPHAGEVAADVERPAIATADPC
jgi:hypothetical protein